MTTVSAQRIAALQNKLKELDLDGFLVPKVDEHQGEFVGPYAERLAWLTNFSGSAGTCVVLRKEVVLFVDGRYTLEAREVIDDKVVVVKQTPEALPWTWIAAQAHNPIRIGFDPWLHTEQELARYSQAGSAHVTLVPCEHNLVDQLWENQPSRPAAPAFSHPLEFAGKSSDDKLKEVVGRFQGKGAQAAIVTLPDSLAWLLNIRGADLPGIPVTLGFAIVRADRTAHVFVNPDQFPADVRATLSKSVSLHPRENFIDALKELKGLSVIIDQDTCPAIVTQTLNSVDAKVIKHQDPCVILKARKNQTERRGARQAHKRDGVALTRFLAWLHQAHQDGNVTELSAAEKLLEFRKEQRYFKEPSFSTISGFGSNGAIVHYRVSEKSSKKIEAHNLYLVDSGGQYLDGTTDVTRTVVIGEPSAEHRDRYTRVLKGHIALSMARFPRGTTGAQLDSLARSPLWQGGFDYAHGTGHGVGSYLDVHEGPQRISKTNGPSIELEPGMIVSNEPGYYKNGEYGIRIENLVMVTEPQQIVGGELPMMEFENLTLAPLCRALVDPLMLEDIELEWFNRYQALVRVELTPLLDKTTAKWLEKETAPLPR